MSRPHKKRKLNDASADVSDTGGQDYTFKPIRLRTLEADLEAITHEIVRPRTNGSLPIFLVVPHDPELTLFLISW
jgi:DNA-binding response OmpR family regulator